MNYIDLLKEPHYQPVIFQVESSIHEIDELLKQEQIVLNDTNVKSCLQKVMGFAKGKTPALPESNLKEQGMKTMSMALVSLGRQLVAGSDGGPAVSTEDWILSLKAVEASLKLRRDMQGHSRGYLDFIGEFLGSAEESQ